MKHNNIIKLDHITTGIFFHIYIQLIPPQLALKHKIWMCHLLVEMIIKVEIWNQKSVASKSSITYGMCMNIMISKWVLTFSNDDLMIVFHNSITRFMAYFGIIWNNCLTCSHFFCQSANSAVASFAADYVKWVMPLSAPLAHHMDSHPW